MKKWMALILVGTMVLALAACGKKDDKEDQGGTQNPDTEQDGGNGTTTGSGDSITTPGTGDAITTPDSDTKDDTKPDTTEVDLNEIYEAVKKAYGENYIPSMMNDQVYLEETLGVPAGTYEEFVAEGPMISTHVDTFVAIKAKEGKTEEIKEALNTYREYLVNDSMQYPMNLGKIQASRVEVYGDFVFFVMLGVIPSELEEKGDEEILKASQEQNQIAFDEIEKFFK